MVLRLLRVLGLGGGRRRRREEEERQAKIISSGRYVSFLIPLVAAHRSISMQLECDNFVSGTKTYLKPTSPNYLNLPILSRA